MKPIFEDLAAVMSSAFETAFGAKQEVQALWMQQLKQCLQKLECVQREELEVLKDLYHNLHKEHELLKLRVSALEKSQSDQE